jgi:hypothetical protein
MKNICQSCGMPMKHDPEKGGTDLCGSRSILYCSYCFRDGEFTSPEIDTPEKMQKFCMEKMKEMGMPGFIAWIFTRKIPRLKRWKDK